MVNLNTTKLNLAFKQYLYRNVPQLKEFQKHLLNEFENAYIFSGVIRDFFMGEKEFSKDIDIVYYNSSLDLYQNDAKVIDICKLMNLKFERVDGDSYSNTTLKFDNAIFCDVFSLTDAITIRGEAESKKNIKTLIDSAFFNFSNIAYDLSNERFIYGKWFEEFLKCGVVDKIGHNFFSPYLQLAKTIAFIHKHPDFTLGDRLKTYFSYNARSLSANKVRDYDPRIFWLKQSDFNTFWEDYIGKSNNFFNINFRAIEFNLF